MGSLFKFFCEKSKPHTMSQIKLTSLALALLTCLLSATQVLAQADLSLALAQQPGVPRQYSDYTVTATLTNNGPEAATGVTVSVVPPAGAVFTGGREFSVSQGTFSPYGSRTWTVGQLGAGQTATLELTFFLLDRETRPAFAQVATADQADPDSTPGNGAAPTPREDDEASTDEAVAPACDLVITVANVSCIVDNGTPDEPGDDRFTALVTVTSESRGAGGALRIGTLLASRFGADRVPAVYGTPIEVTVRAGLIEDGRFNLFAFDVADVLCNRGAQFTAPSACAQIGTNCPFVGEPVTLDGFLEDVEVRGSGFAVTSRTFDANGRVDSRTEYLLDNAGRPIAERVLAVPPPEQALSVRTVDGRVELLRGTGGGRELVGTYDDPRPNVPISNFEVFRFVELSDGYLVALSYVNPDAADTGFPDRQNYGFAALRLDLDFNLLASYDYGFGNSFPSEGISVEDLGDDETTIVLAGFEGISALVIAADGSLDAKVTYADRSGRPNFPTDFIRLADGAGYAASWSFEGSGIPQVQVFGPDGARRSAYNLGARIPDGSESYGSTQLLPDGGFAVAVRVAPRGTAERATTIVVYDATGEIVGSYDYNFPEVDLRGVDEQGRPFGVVTDGSRNDPNAEVRLVRFSPTGSLSCEPIRQGSGADLAVFLSEPVFPPSQRVLYSLTVEVRNEGSVDARDVVVDGLYLNEDQKPFSTSSASATFGLIPAGESRFYVVTLFSNDGDAPGLYVQVASASGDDPDSTPGNGTVPVVTEDDESVSTPAIQPDGIDLELSVTSATARPARFDNNVVIYTLLNDGNAAATGVEVSIPTPEGVVLTGGNEFVASQGAFSPYGDQVWTVGELAPGASATIAVSYFRLSQQAYSIFGEVSVANETDVDSTPGNGDGVLAGEDDEANIIFVDFAGAPLTMTVAPNPAQPGQTLRLAFDLPAAAELTSLEVEAIVTDIVGRVVHRVPVAVTPGRNEVAVETADLSTGVYFLAVPALDVVTGRLVVGR